MNDLEKKLSNMVRRADELAKKAEQMETEKSEIENLNTDLKNRINTILDFIVADIVANFTSDNILRWQNILEKIFETVQAEKSKNAKSERATKPKKSENIPPSIVEETAETQYSNLESDITPSWRESVHE